MKLNSDKKSYCLFGNFYVCSYSCRHKGRGDSRNIFSDVTRVTEDGFYRLGTAEDILKQRYARSQLSLCLKNLIRIEDIPDRVNHLRSVAFAQSSGKSQRFVKCMCKTKRQNMKRICMRKVMKCNSKCLSKLPSCGKLIFISYFFIQKFCFL